MAVWKKLCAITFLTWGIINCDVCFNDTSEKPKPALDDELDETFYQLTQIRDMKHPQHVRRRGRVQTTFIAGSRYCPHGSRRTKNGSDVLGNEYKAPSVEGHCNQSNALHSHLPPYMMRSSCPSYLVLTRDENRVPELMVQAVCACRRCGHGKYRKQRSRCRPVYYYRRVLRRVCDKKARKYIYNSFVEPVSTACACVHPREDIS